MAILHPSSKLTYEHYLELPEGLRHEIIEGELWQMTPAPSTRHQRILSALHRYLSTHVIDHGLGEVWLSPVDVILSDFSVVQPDLLFLGPAKAHLVEDRGIFGPPDLVLEILSPSTSRKDKEIKRRLYQQSGVPEYWLVSPEAESILVLTLVEGTYSVHGTFAGPEAVHSAVLAELKMPAEIVFATP